MELSQVSKILGGERVLGKRLANKMDFIKLGNQGVSKNAVLYLAKYLSLRWKQIVDLLPAAKSSQREACKK